MRFLRAKRIGKQICSEGPQSHIIKTGTPTMGGIILLPVIALTIGFNPVDRWSMPLPLAVLTGFAVLGGIDDYMSLVGTRRSDLRLHVTAQAGADDYYRAGGQPGAVSAEAFGLQKAEFKGSGDHPVRRAVGHWPVVHSAGALSSILLPATP
ncbi:MAG: hypothetical protein U0Z44_00155 [Kouleothrix sp.]